MGTLRATRGSASFSAGAGGIGGVEPSSDMGAEGVVRRGGEGV